MNDSPVEIEIENNDNSPLISIIIPVYNCADYLRKAIDSALGQTYKNIEILLIDDGATDKSGEICDEYTLKYSNVRTFHTSNHGVSGARNKGISEATGDYLVFIDGDDWVESNLCESLYSAVVNYGVDCAICGYCSDYENRSAARLIYKQNTVLSEEAVISRLCGPTGEDASHPESVDSLSTACGKLYPACSVKGVAFIESKEIGPSEDLLFNLDIFSRVHSAIYIASPLYHYRKRSSGSVTTSGNPNLEMQWHRLYRRIFNFIQKRDNSDELLRALENRIALNTFNLGLNNACLPTHKDAMRAIQSMLRCEYRKEVLCKLKTGGMALHWKVFYFCARHGMALSLYLLILIAIALKEKVS